MYRCSAPRRLIACGAFSTTNRALLWRSYKDSDFHRLSRERPWWENAAIFVGLLVFMNVSSAVLYFGNRIYHSLRPAGSDLYISSSVDEKVFARPDLAVAAVRMTLHHALSNVNTPFGCPIVAPDAYRPEAEELMDFVWKLHEEQNAFSVPDLWAIVAAKALARLGGPNMAVRRGREDLHGDMRREDFLRFTPSLVGEDNRDVLNLKRVLARQGFSLEQVVALVGGGRTIGFHEAANFHTTETVKPQLRRRPGTFGPTSDEFHLPDIQDKCTLDPYVFGSEYFDLLLNYQWKQRGRWSKSCAYYCNEKDRLREVVLLDPFSEKSAEAEQRRSNAEAMAKETLEVANKRRNEAFGGDTGEITSRSGRSGEAQFLPNVETREAPPVQAPVVEVDTEDQVLRSPCPHISMRGVDVMLLDDALTRGWLHRFSENEVHFYATVGEVFESILERGHNPNKLYMPR